MDLIFLNIIFLLVYFAAKWLIADNKADKLKAENDLLRNELDLYKNHQETT